MPRTVDLLLFALALLVSSCVGWLAADRSPQRRVGALAVLAALLAAGVADRWLAHAVPRDLVDGPWPLFAGLLVAMGAARGASHLPVTSPIGVPAVVPLVLGSLVGVWAGVPETSATVLVAGVVVGVAAALGLQSGTLSRQAAAVVGVFPVGAAVVGAGGDPAALVGGLLCSGTLVALAAGRPIEAVSARSVAVATALQLAASLLAARQIGVVGVEGDDLTVLVAGAVVIVLSVWAAATVGDLREGPGGRRRAPW